MRADFSKPALSSSVILRFWAESGLGKVKINAIGRGDVGGLVFDCVTEHHDHACEFLRIPSVDSLDRCHALVRYARIGVRTALIGRLVGGLDTNVFIGRVLCFHFRICGKGICSRRRLGGNVRLLCFHLSVCRN